MGYIVKMEFFMGVVSRIKKSLIRQSKQKEAEFYNKVKKRFSKNGDLLSIGQFIRLSIKRNSKNIALIGSQRITYKQLYFRSLDIGKKLRLCGVKKRDKVLLYCENSIEFYIFYYAIWLIGAVAVPVNIFLHEKELGHIIKDCDPSAILTLTKLEKKLAGLVENKIMDKLPKIINETLIDWKTPVPKDFKSIDDPFVNDNLDVDELCLLLYTSGTTGVPKGVMLSSRNIITNTMQDYARLRLFSGEKEKFFAVLPLFHVFAQNTCIWLPLMTGSSVIVVSKIDRRYILEGLKKKPTLFFGFPALFGLLCLMKNAPLDSIKRFVSGADAMPDKIRSAFSMIYNRKICAGYGLTEASPVIAINHDDESSPTYVVGRPLLGIECDIRDGTLWVRGDNVMLGYYNAPEATAEVLKNGWLNTGDLAEIDKNGDLAIRGRSKDLIIHKGFNIYPQEVENVLMSHPAVFKAAVIGHSESVVGQVPIAFIAAKGEHGKIEKSLRVLCAQNLAPYKIPRRFICLDDLPMSPTGKVDKKLLQVDSFK